MIKTAFLGGLDLAEGEAVVLWTRSFLDGDSCQVRTVDEVNRNRRHRKRYRVGVTWFNELGVEEPRSGMNTARIEKATPEALEQVEHQQLARDLNKTDWATVGTRRLREVKRLVDGRVDAPQKGGS